MTGEDKSNNQQGGSGPPKQVHRNDSKDEWRDENEDYGDNEMLDKSGIAAIIRQMSDSFNGIAKEIRDARPQAFPRETNIIPVQPFWGNDSEDPEEWLKHFEIAAIANNWTAERKRSIVAGY